MDAKTTPVVSGVGNDKVKLGQFMAALEGLIAGARMPFGMRFKSGTPHSNKFKPHQGAKEIARRKRQMKLDPK